MGKFIRPRLFNRSVRQRAILSTLSILAAVGVNAFCIVYAQPPEPSVKPPQEIPSTQQATGRIAFSTYTGDSMDIYVLDDNGQNLRRLTENNGNNSQPVFSPDGSRIVFVSDRDGDNEIYVMNSDGTYQVRLTDDPENDHHPSFSPDGKQIIFSSRRDDTGPMRPYIMDIDGGDLREVKLGGSRQGGQYPNFGGPDGRLVFSNGVIFVAENHGAQVRRVTQETGYGARISSDGERIVFARQVDKKGDYFYSSEIFQVNVDGSGEIRLTHSPGIDEGPAFSPDGKQITFFSGREAGSHIYIMNTNGSNVRRLTKEPGFHQKPNWGPLFAGPARDAIKAKQ